MLFRSFSLKEDHFLKAERLGSPAASLRGWDLLKNARVRNKTKPQRMERIPFPWTSVTFINGSQMSSDSFFDLWDCFKLSSRNRSREQDSCVSDLLRKCSQGSQDVRGRWTEKGKNPRKAPSQVKYLPQPDPLGELWRVNYASGCVPTQGQGCWAFRLSHQQLTLPVMGRPGGRENSQAFLALYHERLQNAGFLGSPLWGGLTSP